MRKLVAIGVSLAFGGPALAAGPSQCNGWEDLEPATKISLATVSGSGRVNFVKNDAEQAGCPSGLPACQRKGFVVGGDQVIVNAQNGGYACAQYVNAKGLETTGWLPGTVLTPLRASGPYAASDWLGTWSGNPEQGITIKPGKGAGELVMHGDATWGSLDPERVKRGGVNIGEFDAALRAGGDGISFAIGDKGETLAYDKGEEFNCKIRVRRLGPFLMVQDNRQCGGNNVSFTGNYRRK